MGFMKRRKDEMNIHTLKEKWLQIKGEIKKVKNLI